MNHTGICLSMEPRTFVHAVLPDQGQVPSTRWTLSSDNQQHRIGTQSSMMLRLEGGGRGSVAVKWNKEMGQRTIVLKDHDPDS